MRWEDERYVRVYTRDTAEWSVLSWDARSVFLGLLRKCDRAGIVPVGKSGLRGLAGLLLAPLEVVERAVPELLADGCLRATEAAYIIPNFLPAQEATTSDAQRKRDQRERDRARAVAESHAAGPEVTNRDQKSRSVTSGHEESRAVTPNRAVPNLTEPETTLSADADLFPDSPKKPTFTPTDLQTLWNAYAARNGWAKWDAMGENRRRPALARLREHPERAWWESVFLRAEKSAFLRGENRDGWRLNPDTLLRAGKAEAVLEGKYDGGHGGKVGTTTPERKVTVL